MAHNNIASTNTNNGTAVTYPSHSTTSEYYIHPSDGHNFVPVTPPLDGSNYLAWDQAMCHALSAKNKFQSVHRSTPIHAHHNPSRQAWERCNIFIHSWIANSVCSQIARSIVFVHNILDVWAK